LLLLFACDITSAFLPRPSLITCVPHAYIATMCIETASLLMCLLNVHITADDRHVTLSPGDDARSPPMPPMPPTTMIIPPVAPMSFGDVVETPVKNSTIGEYCQSLLNLPGLFSPHVLSLSLLCIPFSSYSYTKIDPL